MGSQDQHRTHERTESTTADPPGRPPEQGPDLAARLPGPTREAALTTRTGSGT